MDQWLESYLVLNLLMELMEYAKSGRAHWNKNIIALTAFWYGMSLKEGLFLSAGFKIEPGSIGMLTGLHSDILNVLRIESMYSPWCSWIIPFSLHHITSIPKHLLTGPRSFTEKVKNKCPLKKLNTFGQLEYTMMSLTKTAKTRYLSALM